MDEDDEVVKEGENENKIRQKKRIISKNINFNHHPKVNHLFSVLYMFAIYVWTDNNSLLSFYVSLFAVNVNACQPPTRSQKKTAIENKAHKYIQ